MLVNFRNKDAFGPFASQNTQLSHRPSTSTLLFESFDTTPVPSPTVTTLPLEGEIDSRFVPVLPDDFFAVLDQAKAHHYGISAALLREREHLGGLDGDTSGTTNSTGDEWFDWRENSGEYNDDDEEEEASVGSYGVLETPRQNSGAFESNPLGHSI